MAETVTIRVPDFTAGEAYGIVAHMEAAIHGRVSDTHGFAHVYWSAVAHSLFQSIYSSYVVKSTRGRDSLGQRWKDIRPKTKAYARHVLREGLDLPGPHRRPTLNPYFDRIWRRAWKGVYKYLAVRMDEGEAKSIAAGFAWNRVKALGATTLLELLGDKNAVIMVRTGRLIESLTPAPMDGRSYRPDHPDQIFRYGTGGLEVGTSVEYAEAASEERPLWPGNISPWLDAAFEAGRDAAFEYLREVIQSRRTATLRRRRRR